ncbi:MAG TPA: hypothetical protein VEB22_03730 [Phycisphaerales bacterium]|nr:hypothetical protein [Phycisphaerales bacterium]
MTPVRFPEMNTVLTPPTGMPDCGELPSFRDGRQCISCWQPDDAERAAIAAGAPVWLVVVSGKTQPPVAVTSVSPFLPPVAHEKG